MINKLGKANVSPTRTKATPAPYSPTKATGSLDSTGLAIAKAPPNPKKILHNAESEIMKKKIPSAAARAPAPPRPTVARKYTVLNSLLINPGNNLISACKTLKGEYCRFPFKYKGKVFKKCTNLNSENGKAWCATKTVISFLKSCTTGLCFTLYTLYIDHPISTILSLSTTNPNSTLFLLKGPCLFISFYF